MKYVLPIAFVMLTACKAQKTVTNADFTANVETLAEATKTAAAVKETATTTDKQTTAVIDFVKTEYFPPDSTGQPPRVKSVTKGQAVVGGTENKVQQETEQLNMEATRTDSVKANIKGKQEKTVARTPWYDSIVAKAGTLCCIAFLLWLLFMYLKRKF